MHRRRCCAALIFAALSDSHGNWADATSALLYYVAATYVSQPDARGPQVPLLTSVEQADARPSLRRLLLQILLVLTYILWPYEFFL